MQNKKASMDMCLECLDQVSIYYSQLSTNCIKRWKKNIFPYIITSKKDILEERQGKRWPLRYLSLRWKSPVKYCRVFRHLPQSHEKSQPRTQAIIEGSLRHKHACVLEFHRKEWKSVYCVVAIFIYWLYLAKLSELVG